jgi:hypothetical protein
MEPKLVWLSNLLKQLSMCLMASLLGMSLPQDTQMI